MIYRGIRFKTPVSITREKPPKPVGFFWREGFELRMSVLAVGGGGARKQPYIGGMALSTWQKQFYDKYKTDAERLDALAGWIAEKLDKKSLQPPTAD